MKKIVNFFGDNTALSVSLNRKAADYAESLGLEYSWAPQLPYSQEAVIRALQEADAGIINAEPYGEPVFSRIKNSAKLLVRFGVGYDNVDLAAATAAGIAVARTTGANASAVAETALLLVLACRRKLNRAQAQVKAGLWGKDVGSELIGGTAGIVGFGHVGRIFARLLSGFDCTVLVYDPMLTEEDAAAAGVKKASLEELFALSDAVSIHAPLTDETRGLIGADLLDLMKPEAVLVNTARGGIVDEDALTDALNSGRLAGARLDVFAQEPLPADSPLRSAENLILTPHNASQSVESLWNIYKTAIDICADFFAGRPSAHILNPEYAGR